MSVVVDETSANLRSNAESRRSTQRFSPRERLALIKKTVFRRRNKLLPHAEVIGIIGFPATGQGDNSAVMKVVIPHSIQIVTTFAARPHHLRLLQVVLGDENN